MAQGYGPLGAGLRLLPLTATLFVIAPIAGALVNRVGERPLPGDCAELFCSRLGNETPSHSRPRSETGEN